MAKKNKVMNVKHFFILLITALCCVTEANAYDYPYLILEKTDGTTVSVSTTGISLSVSGTASATLTVNNTAYEVTGLSKMYFSQSALGSEVVTIPSLGWATFCSSSALDFTSVSGLTAYTATVSGETMTLTPLVAAVPGNTGVIVSGVAGDYAVPVVESASALADNDLLGTTSSLTTTGDYKYYALGQVDDNNVGFRLVETGVEIPANKAYYRTSSASAPAYLWLDVDGYSTAIEGIESQTEQTTDDGWYTLDGRKFSSRPTQRGLYIWQGKKYVIR